MTTNGNTVLQANENIATNVRTSSIMLGKNRTLLKSEANSRRIGLWNFGQKNIGVHPFLAVPPVTDPLLFSAYYHEIYTAQVNYHKEIDVLLLSMTADHSFVGSSTLNGGAHSNLTKLFRDNAMLPPNKNVYFVSDSTNTIVDGLHRITLAILYGTGDVNHPNGVSTAYYIPHAPNAFIDRNPFQKSGATAWTGLPTNNVAFIKRTDAFGKIPNMDARPTDHLEVGSHHTYFDEYNTGFKFQVYEIKDRYDCNDTFFPFFTRRYQELTDNEWDTKVATDA